MVCGHVSAFLGGKKFFDPRSILKSITFAEVSARLAFASGSPTLNRGCMLARMVEMCVVALLK